MNETAQADEAALDAQRKAALRSFLPRVLGVFAAWDALHFGVVAALAWSLVPGRGWTLLAVYLLLLAPLLVLVRGFVARAYPGAPTRLFVMRPFWYAQLALPFLSLAGALGFLVGLPFGHGVAAGRAAMLGVGVALAALCVAGWIGARTLVVRRHELRFRDLPEDLEGLTVAQLSDLHVGPHLPRRFLRRAARAVEDAKPDLVAFTGDQVDDFDQDVAHFNAHFGHLRAPLGVYAIAGNHDVYAGWTGVRAGMEDAGMKVLVNASERVRRGATDLYVVGTGDPAGAQQGEDLLGVAPDLQRALADVPPGAFTVALAHNPALWPALAQRGVHVTLSGHTHHGQLSVPFLKWSLASPFLDLAMGHHERDGARLYIHPGTGYWGVPFRLGAWPEVALLTLRRA